MARCSHGELFYCCLVLPTAVVLLDSINQHNEIGITLSVCSFSSVIAFVTSSIAATSPPLLLHALLPVAYHNLRMQSCASHAPTARLSSSPLNIEHCVLQLRMDLNVAIGSITKPTTPGLAGSRSLRRRRQVVVATEITSSSLAD